MKLILMGAKGVGKSSLIQRIHTNTFQANISPSSLQDFILINRDMEQETHRIQIFDLLRYKTNLTPIFMA